MPRKRKLSNVKERCRICLVEHGCMSNLFDEHVQSKIKDLTKCTSIDIRDEHDLPTIICHICLYNLDTWNEFKQEFIRSNRILLSQLELSETSDDVISHSKRTHSDRQHSDDSLSDNPDVKKPKAEMPSLIPLDFPNADSEINQRNIKKVYISDDDPTSSKDSSQKALDISTKDTCKNEKENEDANHVQVIPSLVPMKVKSLSGKRGRTTERRKASTKRWVARKKALLAATGENASDTDSLGSDDTQLSPVQNARSKGNTDKDIERQKRLAKALRNLETNMTGKYAIKHNNDSFICLDTDSDTRRTRSQKGAHSDVSQTDTKNSLTTEDAGKENDVKKTELLPKEIPVSKEKEMSPSLVPEKTVAENLAQNNDTPSLEDIFTPRSVKSELEIGDATYIVTSTLILAEPNYLNKTNLNSLSKDYKNGCVELNSQEKNTDIIDAVQLRRINPIPSDPNDKKCIERCLNIEVEGTEIEALKRVQVELAGFVEKEMKHRLFGTNSHTTRKGTTENICTNSYQTLDQQLKNIVEKTIKKNFESSMLRSCGTAPKLVNPNSRTVSPTFVKTAITSKKYQPKVLLKRLDITKESQSRKINNVHAIRKRTVKKKLGGPFSMVARKRQSVLPIRYNDYNTSPLDYDSDLSEENEAPEIVRSANVRNVQKTVLTGDQSNIDKQTEEYTIISPSATKTYQKIENSEDSINTRSSVDEKHTCGICNQSFDNRNDVTAHVRTHKTESTIPRHNKHKMMRCKRCHEVVEARFVKAHVCKSTKQVHKCYVCNSTFRTEKLLVRHLESHDQSEFNIENITKGEPQKLSHENVSEHSKEVHFVKSEKTTRAESVTITTPENTRMVISSDQPETTGITKGTKLDVTKGTEKLKEAYTCFVCDKIFTDDEILKDHLQKHCDDMSEDEQSNGKEQYQCAICGDSMDSEDALEAHVEKHLFDEEDDNPNLINIANENEKSKKDPYQCLQCAETFNSEMLLEMHMQAHEEEAAIAEWEKQGIKSYEFQCMICDELFETEDELSEHLDIHNGNAHVCQLCDKPFPSLEDLQKHVATH